MRLFIAIDLPEKIKEILRRLQKELPEAKMSLTSDFHLTLKFLGSCDEDMLHRIEVQLSQVEFRNFEAELKNIGVFGGKRNPRVIWVGLRVPEWLKKTAGEIEDKMARLGFEKENRFVPHLTLSRVKFTADPKKFAEDMEKITVPKEKFAVSGFYVFSSELSSKGAVYTKLKRFP